MARAFKVLLLGNGPTSLSALEGLAQSLVLVGLLREVAEGAKEKDEVVRHARRMGVPVYFDTSAAAIDALVRELQPDCVVVSSYNRILGPEILKNSHFVNVHYAPLPRYRGRACVNWAIINGESHAAISIHELVPGLDAGNVLFQQLVQIAESDTVTDLYRRLNEIQKRRLAATVTQYLAGDAGTPQVEADATYGCTRVPEDGEINWAATTRATYDLIRSLTDPFPGAYTYLDGRQLLVWRAEPVQHPPPYSGRIPGRVVAISRSEGYVEVLTGDGILRVLEVQYEGQGKVSAATVLRSVKSTLGLRTADLLARIRTLEQRLDALTEACGQPEKHKEEHG